MRTKESWFPKFKPHTGNLETPVQIDEYLPSGKSIVLGLQHAFAMFGIHKLWPDDYDEYGHRRKFRQEGEES